MNKSVSFLEKFGKDALKVITFGAAGAEAAAPFVASVNPALGALLGGSAQIILAAETAGQAAVAAAPSADTGAQKAAIAVQGIAPLALQFTKQLGLSEPTQAQVQTFNNYMVAALKVFGVVQTEVAAATKAPEPGSTAPVGSGPTATATAQS
ncbi:MAG TPA: hypothetical protein VFW25_12535 [Silvibacterium sp.]|nr:hypothetical protein [Silvibacterium sp.]